MVLLVIYQIIFGDYRLYYDNYFHIFLLIEDNDEECYEIRIGKSLFSMDAKIMFTHRGDLNIFYMIPQNDTIFLYDSENWVKNTSNGNLIIHKVEYGPKEDSFVGWIKEEKYYSNYGFVDSTALHSTQKEILIHWNLKPCIRDRIELNEERLKRIL